MGVTRIGAHTFDLPDDEARELGQAATVVQRRGGWIAPTDDLLIYVSPVTNVSVQIDGVAANEEAMKPRQILAKAEARKQRTATVWP